MEGRNGGMGVKMKERWWNEGCMTAPVRNAEVTDMRCMREYLVCPYFDETDKSCMRNGVRTGVYDGRRRRCVCNTYEKRVTDHAVCEEQYVRGCMERVCMRGDGRCHEAENAVYLYRPAEVGRRPVATMFA